MFSTILPILYEYSFSRNPPLWFRILSAGLLPLSFLYRSGVAILRFAYFCNILPRRKLPVFVISIGNLTLGGSGKTPLVRYLARHLSKEFRVGILSRGYAKSDGTPSVLWRNKGLCPPISQTGDEPALLAEELPEIPISVNRDRYAGGRALLEMEKFEVLLLDDGFQHWKLDRDLDCLVVSGNPPFGNRRCVPAGPLRESLVSIERADIVFLHADLNEYDLREEDSGQIVIPFEVYPRRVFPSFLKDNVGYKMENIPNDILSFCGIGRPLGFSRSIERLGISTCMQLIFPDHEPYSEGTLQEITDVLKRSGACGAVTTLKDAVKLGGRWPKEIPLFVLDVEVEIKHEMIAFLDLIRLHVRKQKEVKGACGY